MAYFEDYSPSCLRANVVPKEGIYLTKISDITQGTMDDGRRYVQVKCTINCEGNPVVSLFLTEGGNFNGNLTAFFDTFGIERGNFNFDAWINKRGYLKILLQKKGEYMNMNPRYILNEDGFVVKPNNTQNQNYSNPQHAQQSAQNSFAQNNSDDIPDFIPF